MKEIILIIFGLISAIAVFVWFKKSNAFALKEIQAWAQRKQLQINTINRLPILISLIKSKDLFTYRIIVTDDSENEHVYRLKYGGWLRQRDSLKFKKRISYFNS